MAGPAVRIPDLNSTSGADQLIAEIGLAPAPPRPQPQRGWFASAIRMTLRPSGGEQVLTSTTGLAKWLILAGLVFGRGLGNITAVRPTCDAAGPRKTASAVAFGFVPGAAS